MKVGDKVICINNDVYIKRPITINVYLTKNKVYTIIDIDNNLVFVINDR